ncbi:MAG: hypothetical protein PF542_00685 [Nanoarchaeota archaeon]|jgi:hypothetical protein|nr:hypothetical protein [Nanoarchaeota archaeon]
MTIDNYLQKIIEFDHPLYNKEKSQENIKQTIKFYNHGLNETEIFSQILEDKKTFKNFFENFSNSNELKTFTNHLENSLHSRGYPNLKLEYSLSAANHIHEFTPQRPYLSFVFSLYDSIYGRLIKYRIAPFIGELGKLEIEAGVVSTDKKRPINKKLKSKGIHSGTPYHGLGGELTSKGFQIIEPFLKKEGALCWNLSASHLYSMWQVQHYSGAKIDITRQRGGEEIKYLKNLEKEMQKNNLDISFNEEGEISIKNKRELLIASNKFHIEPLTAHIKHIQK